MLIKKLTLLLLLCLICHTAKSWKLEQNFSYGSSNYKEAQTIFLSNFKNNTALGLNYSAFTLDSNNGFVSSFGFPYYRMFTNAMLVVEPFFYPHRNDLNASAQGLNAAVFWELFKNTEKETQGQISLSAALLTQEIKIPGSPNKSVPEISYEAKYFHDFYQKFNFLFSAALFQYLTSVKNNLSYTAIADQRRIAFLGPNRAVTKLPSLSLGIEFSRSYTSQNPASLFVGYNYIEFKTSQPAMHSFKTGFRLKSSENGNFGFSYNHISQGSFTKKDYYGAVFELIF